MLIRSSDFNVTSELVAATYGVPRNMVKVLTQTECDLLETETAYRPESEGVLIHSGSCASFLGGLRAALCAAQGEHMARLVQAAAIILSAILGVVLAFAAGLGRAEPGRCAGLSACLVRADAGLACAEKALAPGPRAKAPLRRRPPRELPVAPRPNCRGRNEIQQGPLQGPLRRSGEGGFAP